MSDIAEVLAQPPRAAMLPAFILDRVARLAAQDRTRPLDAAATRAQLVEALGVDQLPAGDRVDTVGILEFEDYRIQKLVYEGVAGLPVPALLYLPNTPGPHPAVVHAPGHVMEDGKLAPQSQELNQTIVRNGIALLTFDPLGQGERRIGWHQHGQLAPYLVGISTLGFMVRDILSGIDLLQRRPDIAVDRLGVTGASGGGFAGIFAAAIDDRIVASAIGCIVNTHLSQIRDAAFGTGWDSWIDLCNQVPKLAAIGTMGRILATIAPRELLVVNAQADRGFPIEGAREVAAQTRALLEPEGLGGHFRFAEVPGGHGIGPDMRRDFVRFFLDTLAGSDRTVIEPPIEPLPLQWEVPHYRARAERPWNPQPRPTAGTCLPEPIDSNEPVVRIARERAARLGAERAPLTTDALGRVFGPVPARDPLRAVVTDHIPLEDGHAQRLRLTTEPGIELDCVLLLPLNWSDDLAPVLIVLDAAGKSGALGSDATRLARERGWAVLLPDLRGTGESAASEFEVATAAWMLDRDLLSQRVWDVLRLVDFVSERYSSAQQLSKGEIVVWGEDPFGLVALLAAALDPRIAAVGATGPDSLVDTMTLGTRRTPMAFPYGALSVFDLPDLAECIAPRPVVFGAAAADTGTALDRLLPARRAGQADSPGS